MELERSRDLIGIGVVMVFFRSSLGSLCIVSCIGLINVAWKSY